MQGVILVNIGTPRSPRRGHVARYLREFLMDPFVIDVPAPLRWFLVNLAIVPRRAALSASLYSKIWSSEGSPLLVHSRNLTTALQETLGNEFRVVLGMRYGDPSLKTAISDLRNNGVKEAIVCPLYPQYSLAATQSAMEASERVRSSAAPSMRLKYLHPFHQKEEFLSAFQAVAEPKVKAGDWDAVLFSFHGLPERQVRKTDPSRNHCLSSEHCCDRLGPENRDCYRAQCFATARALTERLKIPADKTLVGFQSRLKDDWIRPFSDDYYRMLPAREVKRLLVISPSFVADCLETVEEVALRGRDEFLANGGTSLSLVPSLNASPSWVSGLASLVRSIT